MNSKTNIKQSGNGMADAKLPLRAQVRAAELMRFGFKQGEANAKAFAELNDSRRVALGALKGSI